jgi:hypothetical protein
LRAKEASRYVLPFSNEHQRPPPITRNGKEVRGGPIIYTTLSQCLRKNKKAMKYVGSHQAETEKILPLHTPHAIHIFEVSRREELGELPHPGEAFFHMV